MVATENKNLILNLSTISTSSRLLEVSGKREKVANQAVEVDKLIRSPRKALTAISLRLSIRVLFSKVRDFSICIVLVA